MLSLQLFTFHSSEWKSQFSHSGWFDSEVYVFSSAGGLGTSLRPGRRRSWEGPRPRIAGREQVEREKVSTSQYLQDSGRDFSLRVDPYSRHIR